MDEKKKLASEWFASLRDAICDEFEKIENEAGTGSPATFKRKKWDRPGGGGGEMSVMTGDIFEKVGVNISTVHGTFSEKFAKDIPGTEEDPTFWASGISLVTHMKSPHVPTVHMNTRMIVTSKQWFGGGADLTPTLEDVQDTQDFHDALKVACDKSDPGYYKKFKEECDKYFYIPHRHEARGVGGIFYDYLNTDDWNKDFEFTKDVGKAFLAIYPEIVRRHCDKSWTNQEKEMQFEKRSRYAEFNLVYDRGTKFGLMTGGNTEAILMSLPPEVKWKTKI